MEKDLASQIKELLETTEIKDEDFRRVAGTTTSVHNKVVDAIRKWWIQTYGFTPKGETLGLDFLGRDTAQGRILLTVEVDLWNRPYPSWRKLMDIRSVNMIWVYITKDEEQAEDVFRSSVEELTLFLTSRKEDKATFGKIIAFIKTPSKTKMVSISPGA